MRSFGLLLHGTRKTNNVQFPPFLTKGEVRNSGSIQKAFERVAAVALSSTTICVDMFSCKPISVCIFVNHRKEDFTSKCTAQ